MIKFTKIKTKDSKGTQYILRLFGIAIWISYHSKDWGWIRIFGRGLRWKDYNKHGLMFSERYGYTKYIKIGKWAISSLHKVKSTLF